MTLKTKNSPYIIGFVILIYVGFAYVNGLEWGFAETIVLGQKGLTLKNPVLTLAFYILALVLTYILPSEWKHRLIYARWNYPLPGSRVFTDLLSKDSRISCEDLAAQYGDLPAKPDEQNALWYKIYKTKQTDKVVLNSHGRWLLFRDVLAVAIVLAIPSTVFTYWNVGGKMGTFFTILYLLLIVALWICARNTGQRFACNVLAR